MTAALLTFAGCIFAGWGAAFGWLWIEMGEGL